MFISSLPPLCLGAEHGLSPVLKGFAIFQPFPKSLVPVNEICSVLELSRQMGKDNVLEFGIAGVGGIILVAPFLLGEHFQSISRCASLFFLLFSPCKSCLKRDFSSNFQLPLT